MKQSNKILAVVLALCMVIGAVSWPAMDSKATDETTTDETTTEENTYFFFDNRVISEKENAEYALGEIEKTVTNYSWIDQYGWTFEQWDYENGTGIPVWEHRVSILYPYVEYDPTGTSVTGETGTAYYKMWYQTIGGASIDADDNESTQWWKNIIDKNNYWSVEYNTETYNINPEGYCYGSSSFTAYAESKDGINWTRPDCGQLYYLCDDGTTVVPTNLVGAAYGVTKNTHPDAGNGEPLYIAAAPGQIEIRNVDSSAPDGGVVVLWSDDGIHWLKENRVAVKTYYDGNLCMKADTHNQIVWCEDTERYVIISRGLPDNDWPVTEERWVRTVLQMSSTEELTSLYDLKATKDEQVSAGNASYWTETSKYFTDPKIVLDGDDSWQPYSVPTMQYEDGYYIGIASMADFTNGTEGTIAYGKVNAELVWSPDLETWYYMDGGKPFIDNAEEVEIETDEDGNISFKKGNDYGMIYCAKPIDNGEGMQIYYAAVPERHYMSYETIPDDFKTEYVDQIYPLAADAEMFTRTTTLNVASFAYDAFAGYSASDDTTGSLTTTMFKLTGDTVRVGASTSEDVTVTMLDSEGNTIATGILDSANQDERDRYAVAWEDAEDLTVGSSVSFKVEFTGTVEVYSISGTIEAQELTVIEAEDSISIDKYETVSLGVNVIPASQSVSYSGYDTSIISVDSDGNVKGLKQGTTTITVTTTDGTEKQIPVTVTDKDVPLFFEDFEEDLSEWGVRDSSTSGFADETPYTYVSLENANSYKGTGSLGLQKTGKQVLIRKTFDESYNKVVSVWFYDDVEATESRVMACVEKDNGRIALGVRKSTSSENYTLWRTGAEYEDTGVARSTGWHQFVFDTTSTAGTNVYIDGVLVKYVSCSDSNLQSQNQFNQITLGWWESATSTTNLFDNVRITDKLPWETYVESPTDFTATYVEPVVDDETRNGLYELQDTLSVTEFTESIEEAYKTGAFSITSEIAEKLKAGAVIEIEYDCTDAEEWLGVKTLWFAGNDANGDWQMIGWPGSGGVAQDELKWNDSGTIVQITYETLNSYLASEWNATGGSVTYQSGGACTIKSITIGTIAEDRTNLYTLANEVEAEAYSTSISQAWTNGEFTITDEIAEKLVSGSVIEISYTSNQDNDWSGANLLWFEGTGSNGTWQMIGYTGSNDNAVGTVVNNESCNIVQITYEMLETYLASGWNEAGNKIYYKSGSTCTINSIKIGQRLDTTKHNVVLSWTNPLNSEDWDKIVVVRSTEAQPTSTADGEVIYEGTADNYIDVLEEVENAIYYYSVFAVYETAYSDVATAQVDLMVTSATLGAASVRYAKDGSVGLTTTVTWNDATTITDITVSEASIGENYTVSENTLVISKEYLDNLESGEYVFTIVFDKGDTATLKVQIIDSYPLLNEDFEYGIDTNVWTQIKDGSNGFTDVSDITELTCATVVKTENAHSGEYVFGRLYNESGSAYLKKTFSKEYQKVVSVWIYDDGESSEKEAFARLVNGATYVGLGIRSETKADEYVYVYSANQWKATGVARSKGWHQFVFDFTSGSPALYVDGKLVKQFDTTTLTMTAFRQVWLGWNNVTSSGNIYFDDISITDTLDLCYYNIADYKANGTYPTKDGYVFAGWYVDEACTTTVKKGVTEGCYYAKFVDEDVLTVKYQLTADVTEEAETTNLRLITTVDSLKFRAVGFKVVVNGEEKHDVSSNTVWQKIEGWSKTVDGTEEVQYYTPWDSFTETSNYFMAYEFYNVPVTEFTGDNTMVVTPYWVTSDGTTVTGTPRTITIDGEVE